MPERDTPWRNEDRFTGLLYGPGIDPAVTVLRTLVDRHFKGKNVFEIMGDDTPYQYGCIRIFSVAYPGYLGMRAF